MKAFVKLIIYIGFLFFGGGFLIALGEFIIYNGIGDIFKYKEADHFYFVPDTTSMPAKLTYKYIIDGKEYQSHQNVSTETAKLGDFSQFTVLYNTTFHKISVIKELKERETKTWDQMVGMIIFGFFFIFILVVYKFADMDKWIGVYTRGEYKSSKKKNN